MAAPLLVAAALLLLLGQNSVDAVDGTELAGLVTNLLNVYKPTNVAGNPPMFCLAISVPFNPQTRRYDFSQVTAADSSQNVRSALDRCEVYEGSRVVGATLLKWPDVINQCPNSHIPNHWTIVRELCPNSPTWAHLSLQCTNNMNKKLKLQSDNGMVEHAEHRVLQRFNTLVNRLNTRVLNRNDLMLFYIYKAPCAGRCSTFTHKLNILTDIQSINTWPNHAVVFSKIFAPVRISTTVSQTQLDNLSRTALTNLGNAINGVGNIYRCVERSTQCSSCAAPGGGVADVCVSDNRSRSPSPGK